MVGAPRSSASAPPVGGGSVARGIPTQTRRLALRLTSTWRALRRCCPPRIAALQRARHSRSAGRCVRWRLRARKASGLCAPGADAQPALGGLPGGEPRPLRRCGARDAARAPRPAAVHATGAQRLRQRARRAARARCARRWRGALCDAARRAHDCGCVPRSCCTAVAVGARTAFAVAVVALVGVDGWLLVSGLRGAVRRSAAYWSERLCLRAVL